MEANSVFRLVSTSVDVDNRIRSGTSVQIQHVESKCFIIEEAVKLVVDQDKSINTNAMPSAKKDAEKMVKAKSQPPSNPKKSRKKQKEPEKEVSNKKLNKEVSTKKPEKKLQSSSIDMDVELLEDQVPPSIIIQEDNSPSRLDLKKIKNNLDKADDYSSKSKSLLGSQLGSGHRHADDRSARISMQSHQQQNWNTTLRDGLVEGEELDKELLKHVPPEEI